MPAPMNPHELTEAIHDLQHAAEEMVARLEALEAENVLGVTRALVLAEAAKEAVLRVKRLEKAGVSFGGTAGPVPLPEV